MFRIDFSWFCLARFLSFSSLSFALSLSLFFFLLFILPLCVSLSLSHSLSLSLSLSLPFRCLAHINTNGDIKTAHFRIPKQAATTAKQLGGYPPPSQTKEMYYSSLHATRNQRKKANKNNRFEACEDALFRAVFIDIAIVELDGIHSIRITFHNHSRVGVVTHNTQHIFEICSYNFPNKKKWFFSS